MLARLPASLVAGPVAAASANALEAITALRRIYCSTTGYDYSHVFVPEERDWLRHAAETGRFRPPVQPIDDVELLDRLSQVEAFEQFLHRAFPGKTRFSIEGLDMLIPVLDVILDGAAAAGGIGRPARHGAPRPPQRAGARAVEAVRADPGRVQGSGAGPRRVQDRSRLGRRREVPRRRRALAEEPAPCRWRRTRATSSS